MRHVAETTPAMLEDLYTQFGWPLYKKYGHAFEAFKVLVAEPDTIWNLMKVCLITRPIAQQNTSSPLSNHLGSSRGVVCMAVRPADARRRLVARRRRLRARRRGLR
jgi:hypothetical protein